MFNKLTVRPHLETIEYKLQIETLSPVYIGDQESKQLSPYTDYFVDGTEIVILDTNELAAKLSETDLERFREKLVEGMQNNRSDFDLKQELNELGYGPRQADELAAITIRRLPNHGLSEEDRLPISPTVNSTGYPFLPGSSVKGALRTAMLYHWLCTADGRRELKKNFRQIERLERLNQKKARLGRRDFRAKQEVEREQRRIFRDIFSEVPLFGKILGSEARHLRVRDGSLLSPTATAVYRAERYRLLPQNSRYGGSGDKNIPQPRQAIQPGIGSTVDISVVKADSILNSPLSYLAEGPAAMAHAFNHFAEECIDNEIYQLEMALNERGEYGRRAEHLIDFYRGLQDRMKAAPKNTFFLRMGAGKTVYDNSLLLSLIYGDNEQKEEERYFRILREAVFGLREDKDLFPVTRTLGPGLEVFGWVKVVIHAKK